MTWWRRWWPKQPAAEVVREPADHANWDDFERAFSTRSGGCVRDCACGRVFYNSTGGWDFEDGELDQLRANPNATDLEWSVGEVAFDGQVFVVDCDCWHRRGRRILVWLLNHDDQIAEFLSQVKTRKVEAASLAPVVD